MNTKQIDTAFEKMIHERGVHERLGITSQQVRNYRQYLKIGQPVSFDLKIKLLHKYGWQEKTYTRKDLISLLNFYARTQNHDPESVIEKWEKRKR